MVGAELLLHRGYPSPPLPPAQMYRNMLFLTDRFIAVGCPSSYSTPLAPPSPARSSIRALSCASSSACVSGFLDASAAACGVFGQSEVGARTAGKRYVDFTHRGRRVEFYIADIGVMCSCGDEIQLAQQNRAGGGRSKHCGLVEARRERWWLR